MCQSKRWQGRKEMTTRSLTNCYYRKYFVTHRFLCNWILINLQSIELICNWFFATEFCLRFISSPNKIKFIRNPYHFLEFLAISPLFFPAGDLDNPASLQRLSVRIRNYIEVFYILRVLRIFTLVPKYSGLRMLLLTLKNSIGELILYIMMLFMTMMLFASFIYYAEQIFEKEDNKFDNILIGFWWAIGNFKPSHLVLEIS